ncbi:MAG: alpha-mannosidase [Phycisphaerae bacterium]
MADSDMKWTQALSNIMAGQKYLAERIESEIEFARGLAELEGKPAWRKLADKAEQAVKAALAGTKAARLEAAAKEAEGVMAPIGKAAKRYTVHCVGHAHIDMNWMWSWPETVAVTNDTFTTVLALMDEFEEFRFSQSQASVYEIMRVYNPALLERIRKRVAEGRWEVTAVHWVEGDKNLASGEAIARHLLYTRAYMAEQFGLAPADIPIDWEPDTFGHAHTVPSIISRAGVTRYYLCRGGQGPLPPVFWWQGPDGRRVLVNRETTWYLNPIGPQAASAMLRFCKATGLKDWMLVYGVGDHGGGPTRRDIIRGRDFNNWPIWPNFRFATTGPYYEILEAAGDKWPVIDGELNFEFTGCYTSQSAIKRANRFGENYCVEAEAAAVLAARALGRPYPDAEIREAWINTLFGHFHDILPGSGVRATREYMLGLFQKTAAITGMVKTRSLRSLAAAIDTSFAGKPPAVRLAPTLESIALGAGVGCDAGESGMSDAGHVVDGPRAFVVFNPLAHARRDVVTATVWDAGTGVNSGELEKKSFIIRTPDGKAVPAQRVGKGHYWGHDFVDLALPADVGPLGYAACTIEEGAAPDYESPLKAVESVHGSWGERIRVGPTTIQNEHLAVEIDIASGGVKRLVDKATGRDLACPRAPMAVLEYVVERPRGMTAWVISDLDGHLRPVTVTSVEMTAKGPHLASVEVKMKLGDSTAAVVYTLKAGSQCLEIALTVNWLERGSRETGTPNLRMAFPLPLEEASARYEIPFGAIERNQNAGQEVPALRWADVTGRLMKGGEPGGCALLNDCKYGHSLDGSVLRLTLLRSSSDPDPLPEVGQFNMKMALFPHGEEPAAADLIRMAAAFNHPLQVIATDVHGGKLPPTAAGLSVEPANVVISSVKKALDGDGIIIRMFETEGNACTAGVTLDKDLLGSPAQAVEVDLLERPVADSTATCTKDGFSVELPAHGIASVRLTFPT